MEQTPQETIHNGWSNYETWTVALWIDNEESRYRYWRGEAKRHQEVASESTQVQDGIWTKAEAARFNLADQLKNDTLEGSPIEEPSVYSDLLNAALSEVNWIEIAENWLSEE